jgi:hypothetical protein
MRWSLLRYDDCWQRNAYCATVNAQHQRMDANRANATGLAAEMCAASKWSLCSLASARSWQARCFVDECCDPFSVAACGQ